MPQVAESNPTNCKRVTRLSARRSSIAVESLPLPRQRRSVCRPIVIDSDSDDNGESNSYRKVQLELPSKGKKKQAEIMPNINEIPCEEEEQNKKNKTMKIGIPQLTPPKKSAKNNVCSSSQFLITPKKKKALEELQENGNVTPPKQKKIENDENVLLSPSSLFKQLQLNSPKKVADEHCRETTRNVFQNARRALHSTLPDDMPGRGKEHIELRNFIKERLQTHTSGSLYVSGPPGTGKTASLSKILNEPDFVTHFKEVYVNCTAIKSSGVIYSRICKDLGIKTSARSEKEYIAAIEKYLVRCPKMVLLVLDEIDQLGSKNQSVLYTIFEWPSLLNAKLALVGIANALDLTDRILPRLQTQCELKPQLMHFAPYSKAQIVEIFTNRLETANVLHLFQPVALQMLAGKVAAVSGDVRRALDIGRRVVEIVEQHQKQEALRCIENAAMTNANNIVDLKHVVGVLNTVYGTTNSLDCEKGDEAFPLQQKIIICALLLIISKARNKDVTVGKLHEVYRKICSKRNLLAIDQAEFVGLCSLIETKGIIRVAKRKEPRLHKVTLEWDTEEVSAALKDKQLMSVILQDVTVLGKL